MWRRPPGAGAVPGLPPSEHDPEEVRRAAEEILSRPEYQWDEPSGSLLERVADWVAERLSELFPGGGGGGGGAGAGAGPSWLAYAIAYLLLFLLIALVAFLVHRAVTRGLLRTGPRRRRPAGEVVVEEGEEDRDWEAEAAAHEARGEWRLGLRCRYRALVTALADRGVFDERAGRTAGEFVDDMRRSCPPASRAFGAATRAFEEAWYGGAEGGPAERDRFVALAGEVLEQARGPLHGDAGDTERALVAPR